MSYFDAVKGRESIAALVNRVWPEGDSSLIDAWAKFAELTVRWAKKTDLVASSTVDGLMDVLFLDAVYLLRESMLEGSASIIDVGAGVGAPAIPLALALPNTDWTLVEPRRRRVVFLRMAVGTLDLASRVSVVEGKIEGESGRLGGFDHAMSRATFPAEEWLEIGRALAPAVTLFAGPSGLPDAAQVGAPTCSVGYETLERGTARSLGLYRRLSESEPE